MTRAEFIQRYMLALAGRIDTETLADAVSVANTVNKVAPFDGKRSFGVDVPWKLHLSGLPPMTRGTFHGMGRVVA
jgi:hypothetical protein